ncbi:unnamed protein product [Phytophthora fragariaefolia]|uniref:Unnamed protein product n=1 Tax=Phytophthora fragariaefolia TaxID=1490495 RepID=A0A9W6U7N8_9STRA|nr:unnamed protein product [Phytophthora fragariaefolia]
MSKLQAHIRGFLVRRRTQYKPSARDSARICSSRSIHSSVSKTDQATQADFETSKQEARGHLNPGIRTGRATSFSFAIDDKLGKSDPASFARSSAGLGWQAPIEPAIKRSYWLPAGASFDRRLPVLPVPKRMMALERSSESGGGLGDDELRLINHSWTPKKRPHQKPCPVRLNPVVIPSVRTEPCDTYLAGIGAEGNASMIEKEERLRRQEELKQKLHIRKTHEKRQLEYELKLKREAESESTERKLMEREEKAVRLQLKILRRRSKEGKIRQVTAEQRREERERLSMAREERHVRLHIKFCARQLSKKRLQIATTSTESDPQPSSRFSSHHEGYKSQRSSATTSRKAARGSKQDDASSDDDGDMSFLDTNFTIPASMQPRKQASSSTGGSFHSKKPVSVMHTTAMNEKKMKKKGLTGAKSKPSGVTRKAPGQGATSLQLPQDREDDCGYGDEFDDVVDEAALSHLIC